MSISTKSITRINKAVFGADTDPENKPLIFHESIEPPLSQKEPERTSLITRDLPYYLL